MFYTYAKWIHKLRWLILVLWVLITVLCVTTLPKLGTVVAQQNPNFIPNNSSVTVAKNLLNTIDTSHSAQSSALVAIHRSTGLTATDKRYFQSELQSIDNHKKNYYVKYVQADYNTKSSSSNAFFSSDHTTEIALIGLNTAIGNPNTANSISNLRSLFDNPPKGSNVYLTGDAPIQQDDITISQSGAKKTEVVTIVLVLIILLIVFRSIIAPFATLISIGLSFLIASSVVAFFAQRGLPVSTFTQTFLIATIFGAGTDYSIIILNRYREELTKEHNDDVAALSATMHAIGKTVIYSSLTVIASFAALYFAKFGLYRSAVGVSIGIFITLIMCLTFLPALMSVLGRHIYFPRKPVAGGGHRPSRFWGWTSNISTRHPWITALVLVIVLVPIGLLFTNARTFDPMIDTPQASSTIGFRVVSNAFGPGQVLPMNIVLNTSQNLRTPSGMATIENISKAVAALPVVNKVESATRPTGTVITSFQLAEQNKQAANGLAQVNKGVKQLGNGLSTSGTSTANSTSGITQLANGANQETKGLQQLQNGVGTLTSNSTSLVKGIGQIQTGSTQLSQSLSKFGNALTQVQSGNGKLQQGLVKVSNSTGTLSQGLSSYVSSQAQLANTMQELANAMSKWAATHPSDATNPSWQQMMALAQGLAKGSAQSSAAGKKLAAGAAALSSSYPSLLKGNQQINQSLGTLASGAKQLTSGASSLEHGASQLYSGTVKYTNGVKGASQGTGSLVQGSAKIASGIQQIQSSSGQLTTGLNKAGNATDQIQSGIQQVENYLNDSTNAKQTGNPGFYLTASTLKTNKNLQKAMNAYISPNGHVANFTVILNDNPYSNQAMSSVPAIQAAAQSALNSSPIHQGEILATGTTPNQVELNSISTQDFIRTMVIILSVIFLLLVLLLRSFISPIYIILSLTATYFVTMGIVQNIAVHLMHQTGLSWPVPFFVFLLLVALGVDYSIFLMSRFDEEYRKKPNVKEAMHTAMSNMGNVIFSAAIIMAGTFGSMVSAGITSLMEIGVSVVIGLMMYTLILLGFFIPASATVIGHAHRWPRELFARKESKVEPDNSAW